MNLLAHQLLSFNSNEIAVGNFIADAVKGKKYINYPKEIQKGILLHRKIDFFMDHHPIPIEGMKRLRTDFSKYSTVIIDVIYDHFLAKNWSIFHEKPLTEFSSKRYKILKEFQSIIPENAQQMLYYMEKGDWLSSYQDVEGIEKALQGMTRRIQHKVPLYKAVSIMQEHYKNYEEEVLQFIPIIQEECKGWIVEINASIS